MTTTTAIWRANFGSASPAFDALADVLDRFQPERYESWPTRAELANFLAAEQVQNLRGDTLSPVTPPHKAVFWQDSYEASIFLRGELPLYAQSWHDFFQVLVWATFPRAKRALNAAHYTALEQRMKSADPGRRAARENALTLFDENGAVVLSSDPELLDQIRRFEWKSVFWNKRDQVEHKLRCVVFGHALYEKLLEPYVGLCAHAVLLQCDPESLHRPVNQLVPIIDPRLAAAIANDSQIAAPRDLMPFPLLGIPGWYDNNFEAFYDNRAYFRHQRTRQL